MKKLKKIYWMLLIVLCAACNDPYDGDTFVVFDTQPAATYLSSRSEDFSEWIHIMKYADLYNAVNQATQRFTLFVPNNTAVQEFYTRRGVSSIEEQNMRVIWYLIILYKIPSIKQLLLRRKVH